jgi:acid phosphatase type 7
MKRLIVHALILIALCSQVFAASVTRGPYLQNGTPTSLVVRWRTDTATDTRVQYGDAPLNLTASVYNPVLTTEHEITVSGLTPNGLYYYSVGSSTAVLAGNDANHYFITFPPAGTDTKARVWVLGDAGTQTSSQSAVRNAYYTFTGTKHTDLWLMLGDNAYNSGTDSEYQGAVFNMYPTMLRKSVVFSTLGNHETAQSTAYVDTYPYFNIFTLPTAGEGGGVPSGTEHFYSFDFGNVHFICLDSMTANRATNGIMANWLRSDLANNLSTWMVAFWHHPPYTKGSHNSDTEPELIQMRQNFNPILEAAGVDLVLSGHSHSYERSFLIDSHYGLSSTFNVTNKIDGGSGRDATPYLKPPGLVAHKGAVYSVAGSSGQTSGGTLNHPAMFVSLNVLGSVVLDFATNQLDFKFVNSSGVVQDYFTMIKGGTANPPNPPTGLTATAGNGQVALTWNPSASATGYNVKRATVPGGPYAVIAPNIATTGYTDTTAANGTTYYYVVSAMNANGESADSSEVSATPSAPTAPAAPSNLVASQSGKKKIALTWTQSASPNVTTNRIYRSTVNGGPYSLIASVPAATSYQNSGLVSRTTYYYVVTAVNSSGLESPASNQASAVAR